MVFDNAGVAMFRAVTTGKTTISVTVSVSQVGQAATQIPFPELSNTISRRSVGPGSTSW
jgi:hypothetical protein